MNKTQLNIYIYGSICIMYYKKIVPIQILNMYATEFMCEFFLVPKDLSSRKFHIVFCNEDGMEILSRNGTMTISGLHVPTTLVENTFDYHSHNKPDKRMFDAFISMYGLQYYDDTYKIIHGYTWTIEQNWKLKMKSESLVSSLVPRDEQDFNSHAHPIIQKKKSCSVS